MLTKVNQKEHPFQHLQYQKKDALASKVTDSSYGKKTKRRGTPISFPLKRYESIKVEIVLRTCS